jgi:hypothetical protein
MSYARRRGASPLGLISGVREVGRVKIMVQAHKPPGRPEIRVRGVEVQSGQKVPASAEFTE